MNIFELAEQPPMTKEEARAICAEMEREAAARPLALPPTEAEIAHAQLVQEAMQAPHPLDILLDRKRRR